MSASAAPISRASREAAAPFAWGERTYVMGIVNASPDSFSGDGMATCAAAVERAAHQLAEGSDIVDVGGQSTRPGHVAVDASEERRRLLPVVRGLCERFPDAFVSVDTFDAGVFRDAHAAGARMLNSIWGLDDDALLAAAVECGVPVAIMHNRRSTVYDGDVVDEVLRYLGAQGARAVAAGIARERVLLDPGIGFGKTAEQNLAVLAALPRLRALGFPTLLGTSRKSTLGKLTGREPSERAFATAATVALAVAAGIDVVRVHDVAAMRDVLKVSDAIVRGVRPPDWQ
ncbi:MAG: dihydropteroate synthase [Candidatus Eremiobacteraeota bacterium]|nr:dihydropteroate synthase [Candidatus Eremiobacteraeota bacterium]